MSMDCGTVLSTSRRSVFAFTKSDGAAGQAGVDFPLRQQESQAVPVVAGVRQTAHAQLVWRSSSRSEPTGVTTAGWRVYDFDAMVSTRKHREMMVETYRDALDRLVHKLQV